jgi:hypothetical protein
MKVVATFNNNSRRAEIYLEDSGTYLSKLMLDGKEAQRIKLNDKEQSMNICNEFVHGASDNDIMLEQVLLNG